MISWFKNMKKNIVIIVQSIIIVVLGVLLYTNSVNHKDLQPVEQEQPNPYRYANIHYELIEAEGNTWGYKVFIENSLFIIQQNKPGLPGYQGFATQEQAQKVAELVITKIRNGHVPPTVTIDELRELGVL